MTRSLLRNSSFTSSIYETAKLFRVLFHLSWRFFLERSQRSLVGIFFKVFVKGTRFARPLPPTRDRIYPRVIVLSSLITNYLITHDLFPIFKWDFIICRSINDNLDRSFRVVWFFREFCLMIMVRMIEVMFRFCKR